MHISLAHISYTYPKATSPILNDISLTFQEGWYAFMGDNGCGKTTLARLIHGSITPDQGTIISNLSSAFCPQSTEEIPDELYDFACDWSKQAQRIRLDLGIQDEWLWNFDSLSGGQRKTLQVAVALWKEPDVIILDEPTNHVDANTRKRIQSALTTFNGIGILVSHDRSLVDALCSHCVMFEAGIPTMRTGTYSQAQAQYQHEQNHIAHTRHKAQSEAARIQAEAQRRREEAQRSASRRSKRHLDKNDSSTREKIGLAIYSGKDKGIGKQARFMTERFSQVQNQMSSLKTDKRYEGTFEVPGSPTTHKRALEIEAQSITLDDNKRLIVPKLSIDPTEHVALVGPNGSGKTTLIRSLQAHINDSIRTLYLPQEIPPYETQRYLAELSHLSPAEKGDILRLVARMNSSAKRILEGTLISPGELRKLVLALGVLKKPHLLILDEPTNHLDAGSITALQSMIATFQGAVLIVSHDDTLVNAVADTQWVIEEAPSGALTNECHSSMQDTSSYEGPLLYSLRVRLCR